MGPVCVTIVECGAVKPVICLSVLTRHTTDNHTPALYVPTVRRPKWKKQQQQNHTHTQKSLYMYISMVLPSRGDHADDDRDKDSCVFVCVFFG